MASIPIRKPGRPAAGESEDRVRHILGTARRVFFEHGYGAASLEGIAAAAGVAKTTIYRHFGSKKALFERCLSDAAAALRVQLAEATTPVSIEHGLRYMARCLLDVIYLPENIDLMRLLFAESARFPELGRAYGSHAKSVFISEMITFLGGYPTAESLDIPNAATAAEDFQHLVMSPRYLDMLMGVATIPDTKERDAIAGHAVRLFLSGYARRDASSFRSETGCPTP